VDLSSLRREFPVLDRLAYLNAGTDGPLPARAVSAATQELEKEAQNGRTHQHFERRGELNGKLRAAYAAVLGCDTADLALTTCTSEGIAQIVGGLELGRGMRS
jgi:selenocysteine lyase/cysteine desulfurase